MIIRRRHTANFTTIGNVLFEDERLAADEVGILAYLLSRPHDWEVRRSALMRRWGMGRDAIKRVVSNLVRYGWCVARKDRLPNGTFFMVYEIRDDPGPTLTDEEVRRALSLVSSEAASDESDVISSPNVAPEEPPQSGDPPTCYPSLADPSLGKAYVVPSIIDLQNTDSPRTESTQKPEREGARAREKHAINLVEFKRRWPTNASDDQARVDGAWYALSSEEGEAALVGIAPFLEEMRRNHRKHPPAGFTYLGQKRWTLLEQVMADAPITTRHAPDSPEAKAVRVLHDVVGRSEAFFKIFRMPDGSVCFHAPITAQLVALAQAGEHSAWPVLDRQQAGAWESLLRSIFNDRIVRQRLCAGSRAPWPWPPSIEGKIYTDPGGGPPRRDGAFADDDHTQADRHGSAA